MSASKSIVRWMGIAIIGLSSAACSSFGNHPADGKAEAKPVRQVVQSPEESQAQYKLGKYYLGQGRVGLALAAFNRSIAQDASNVEARNARGITLVRIGDVKGAVKSLETAVASSPQTPHLLNNLAYAYMLNGSLILAADTLREALRIDPTNKVALENLRQLATRANKDNPKLAKQLADSVRGTDAPVIKVEPAVTPKKSEPRSSRVVPNNVSVINIAFGGAVSVAEPLVATLQDTPAAVDIQAQARLKLRATQTLASARPLTPTIVGASVAGVATVEPIAVHPSTTTIVTSLVPSTTLALRPEMIALKNSALPRYAKNLPKSYSLRKPRVAVSNGNGVRNVAKVLSAGLKRNKLKIWSIVNAKSFNNPVTRIYYNKRFKNEAIVISKMLPVEAELVEKPGALRYSDINIVIGADIGSREMARDILSVPVTGAAA